MKRLRGSNRFIAFYGFLLISVFIFLVDCTGDIETKISEEVKKDVSSVVQVDKIDSFKEKEEVVVVPEVVEEVIVPEVVEEVAPPVTEQVTIKPIIGNTISIDGVFTHPLMKDETGDNFYLNHNIDGVEDGRGVPYIDSRTDFNTRKMIVYAHSSTTGTGPFNGLQNYHNNFSFYQSHPYINVNYDGVLYTYQIFSVYVSVADSEESEGLEYFHKMYYTNSSWDERIKWYKLHSEYETGVPVSGDDKILILQTCSMDMNYYKKYYRYNLLIMGKRV